MCLSYTLVHKLIAVAEVFRFMPPENQLCVCVCMRSHSHCFHFKIYVHLFVIVACIHLQYKIGNCFLERKKKILFENNFFFFFFFSILSKLIDFISNMCGENHLCLHKNRHIYHFIIFKIMCTHLMINIQLFITHGIQSTFSTLICLNEIWIVSFCEWSRIPMK